MKRNNNNITIVTQISHDIKDKLQQITLLKVRIIELFKAYETKRRWILKEEIQRADKDNLDIYKDVDNINNSYITFINDEEEEEEEERSTPIQIKVIRKYYHESITMKELARRLKDDLNQNNQIDRSENNCNFSEAKLIDVEADLRACLKLLSEVEYKLRIFQKCVNLDLGNWQRCTDFLERQLRISQLDRWKQLLWTYREEVMQLEAQYSCLYSSDMCESANDHYETLINLDEISLFREKSALMYNSIFELELRYNDKSAINMANYQDMEQIEHQYSHVLNMKSHNEVLQYYQVLNNTLNRIYKIVVEIGVLDKVSSSSNTNTNTNTTTTTTTTITTVQE